MVTTDHYFYGYDALYTVKYLVGITFSTAQHLNSPLCPLSEGLLLTPIPQDRNDSPSLPLSPGPCWHHHQLHAPVKRTESLILAAGTKAAPGSLARCLGSLSDPTGSLSPFTLGFCPFSHCGFPVFTMIL